MLSWNGPVLVEEEVAEGVDNGDAVVVFVGFDDVGMGTDDGIGSGVDEGVGGFDLGDAWGWGVFDAPVRKDNDEITGRFFGFDGGNDR